VVEREPLPEDSVSSVAASELAVRAAAGREEPRWVRAVLLSIALGFLTLILFVPLAAVFVEALRKGAGAYLKAISEDATLSAIRLTLLTAAIVVPLNAIFGIAAAWLITRFEFRGRNLLLTLIDLPFAVSPVISGLIYVLLLGSHSVLGGWLVSHGFRVIFSTPGIVIATLFVTFPFVARELIPLMQEQGSEDEQAAITLGAGGWQTFWRVTLPRIKWALLYGVVLCNARAIGEFGAVSVVSGHIRGLTNTVPLHVEILYNEYDFTGAFAVASLLTLFALATICLKSLLEWRLRREQTRARNDAGGEPGA
jgi:sulfate transport system permease protein